MGVLEAMSSHMAIMCILAFSAASYADVSYGSFGFQTELLRPVGKAFSVVKSRDVSPGVSPAFNLWTGNNTQTTKQEKSMNQVCPKRQNVQAPGSTRPDLGLKKTAPEAPAENAKEKQHFWEKCAEGACKENHNDSSWDEFTPDGEHAQVTKEQLLDQSDTKEQSELKSQCNDHKDHNMRVGCMVNAVLNTQKEAMRIEETDGKIKVVGVKNGEVHFESTFTTSWSAWQNQESKENEEDLQRWDDFSSSLISDDDDQEEPGMSEVVHSDDFDESY